MARLEALISQLAEDFGVVAKAMLTVARAFVVGGTTFDDASAAIDEVSRGLQVHVAGWVDETLPQIYADGAQDALRDLHMPPGALSVGTHEDALRTFQDELLGRLALATANISEDAKNILREAARRNLAKDASGGVMQGARGFEQELTEQGITFTDRAGRKWDPANYAEMVARTVSAEVQNTGHINTAAELGSGYVRVSDGKADSDAPCREADGQVWTLQYAMAHRIEHPGCRRSFAALPSTYDGKVDRGD